MSLPVGGIIAIPRVVDPIVFLQSHLFPRYFSTDPQYGVHTNSHPWWRWGWLFFLKMWGWAGELVAAGAAGAATFAAGAGAAAAALVGVKLLLGGIAHEEHFALVAYGFAGELVVEVEGYLGVGDFNHETFATLPVGQNHGHIASERHTFAVEFAIAVFKDFFVEGSHQIGVFFAKGFLGGECEIEFVALLQAFYVLGEAFYHRPILAEHKCIGVLFHEFKHGYVLLGANYKYFVSQLHIFSICYGSHIL